MLKRSSTDLILATGIIAATLLTPGGAIINGKTLVPGSFPKAVAIRSIVRAFPPTSTSTEERCSGVIVAPKLVLTAAHCLYQSGLNVQYIHNGTDLKKIRESPFPKHWNIHEKYQYPDKKPGTVREFARFAAYDIAYIVLRSETDVPPMPIAHFDSLGEAINLVQNKTVTLVGYGPNKDKGSDGNYDYDFGVKRTGQKKAEGILENAVLFSGPDQAALPGDSGGPIYVIQDNRTVVTALLSQFARDSDKKYAYLAATLLRKETLCWVEKDSGVDIPSVDCSTPGY